MSTLQRPSPRIDRPPPRQARQGKASERKDMFRGLTNMFSRCVDRQARWMTSPMPFGALTAPNSATRTHSRMSHASERGVAGEPSRIHSRVNRRTLFAGAAGTRSRSRSPPPAALATATAVTGVSSASPARPDYLLVHGGSHGGWCWRKLAPMLQRGENRVITPTITGVGDRSHLLHAELSYDRRCQRHHSDD